MLPQICLDTGIFSIFLEENSRDRYKIVNLFNKIRNEQIEGHVIGSVISEIYYHLCLLKGKDFASSKLISLLKIYPIKLISPNINDLILAGQIKCSDRKKLSYIDCLSIAYSLNSNITFHTTEKQLNRIPVKILERLKIESYWWD